MSAMLGKAMVSNQMSKISKGLGMDDNDETESESSAADLKKIKKEELQKEEEKKKLQEMQAKRRADRAGKRDEIRAKYGLKGKESDASMPKQSSTTQVKKAPSRAEENKSDKCCVM